MTILNKSELKTLYKTSEIATVWSSGHNKAVIEHPIQGLITPNAYRVMYNHKPCPYCGQKMVHGQGNYSTRSRQVALQRGYEYVDKQGEKVINQAGSVYFHPNYVTLDHKTNKARCPEKMFDYDNLQIMCWRCNQSKGDDNAFELQHTCDYLDALAKTASDRYQLLALFFV